VQRDKEQDFGGIASSSQQPRWDLIPRQALLRVIKRFELGIERKKEKAWNARSSNQACLLDKEFVISRATHAINHAWALIDKLEGREVDDGDDDAAAIAWSGIFLCEATRALKEQGDKGTEAPSSPKGT
jgi:hypothetical protein